MPSCATSWMRSCCGDRRRRTNSRGSRVGSRVPISPPGVCVYCPGGPRFGTPQSYLGTEPAARRAADHAYDPHAQTLARLRALRGIGHRTDKGDPIVIGGTFTAHEASYRETFIRSCLDAMNGFRAGSLEAGPAGNESGRARGLGLTIETKPELVLGP